MAVSLWELLEFTSEELSKREKTMTFQQREAERMEALRRFKETNLQRKRAVAKMPSRQNSDTTSASGVSYNAGAASPTGAVVRNIAESRSQDAATNSVLARRWPNPIEVWADGSVFDTVTSTYLQPNRDFQIGELQRR